jgi:hypothetical protein
MTSYYYLVDKRICVQIILALRNFAHKNSYNEAPALGLSSESELAQQKSFPNKNEHVRTKTGTNAQNSAQ